MPRPAPPHEKREMCPKVGVEVRHTFLAVFQDDGNLFVADHTRGCEREIDDPCALECPWDIIRARQRKRRGLPA